MGSIVVVKVVMPEESLPQGIEGEVISVYTVKSIFDGMEKTASNLVLKLVGEDSENAKDFLRSNFIKNDDDLELLSEFDHYTLEALMIYELSLLFNRSDNIIIKLASLIERLEESVRLQGAILKCRRLKIPFSGIKESSSVHSSIKNKDKLYPIGTGLVEFMESRKLISFSTDFEGNQPIKRKKGHYFKEKNLYVICDFDISLLPIKLNLPMLCKPIDWRSMLPPDKKPKSIADISGGYLSQPTGEIYNRYRLLSTSNINNYNISFGYFDDHNKLCNIMNKLQRQAFRINTKFLNYITENKTILEKSGLLMPDFLANLNLNTVSKKLREEYMKDKDINQVCSYTELLNILSKNMQRAHYEQMILNLANAYKDYKFYLPTFVDFRGRIYRSGILHFHERDLARSLIVFADVDETLTDSMYRNILVEAAAFHYKSFDSCLKANKWLQSKIDEDIILHMEFVRMAKRPFQFLSNIIELALYKKTIEEDLQSIPITQDASASAYQIVSYFLLDESLAKRTNLIQDGSKIQDVYSFFLTELKEFIRTELEQNLAESICNGLDRKLVKGIFMPMIYGKTVLKTAQDIDAHFAGALTRKESFLAGQACYSFWKKKYPGIHCLIRLIRNIGWIMSAQECPVTYRIPSYFSTIQDYMKTEPIQLWVYDRNRKKRHKVTLRVSSSKRDRRKTELSTFVNFIHQKDAQIAMSVIDKMLHSNAPIYTVHDNFISVAKYSKSLPSFYSQAFSEMGPPLGVINRFIYINIIKPNEEDNICEDHYGNEVISRESLEKYLKYCVPQELSKYMRATWDKKIVEILDSYEEYVNRVSGPSYIYKKYPYANRGAVHKDNWKIFREKIIGKRGLPSHCLHY